MIIDVGLTGDEMSTNQDNVREGTRTYLVVSNNPFETTLAVRLHPKVPKPFDRHPTEPGVYAKVPTVSRVTGNKFQWTVVVTYSSEVRDRPSNPLARPPKISGDFVDHERPAHVDRNKKPLLTTAGEPLSGVTTTDSDLILNIEKNLPGIPRWALTHNNAINDGAVRLGPVTFPKGTLKVRGIRFSDIQWENDVPFIVLSFQLHFRRIGWKRKHVNAGRIERTANGPEKITLEDGSYPNEPVLLDRSGRAPREKVKRKDRSGKEVDKFVLKQFNSGVDPGEIHILEFELDDELPFSVLPTR